MTYLKQYIKDNGPTLSSELIELLVSRGKAVSESAARQQLSRLKGDVIRIRGLFKDRQVLFHDPQIYGSEEYYEGILKALKKSGRQYYVLLKSLNFHYGFIKHHHLAAYSVNPTKLLKGHLSFDSAITKLQSLNLIIYNGEYITVSSKIATENVNLTKAKAIEVAKHFLLVQFNDWARKIGIASYNSSSFHSDFASFQFNYVCPSYVGNLPKISGKKIIPAFIVADILIGNVINKEQVEFMVNKVRSMRFRNSTVTFIPFLIVDSVDTEALNYLKAEGIAIGFVNELFGKKYKDLLNSLINLVTNAGAILKKNPEAYLDLILKLNKLVDGKTNNLRGDLFELAVGYHQAQICKSIDIGRIVNFDGQQREIDVLGIQETQLIISECKGYNKPIDVEDIETWLGKKIPIIRKWLLDQGVWGKREHIFEFWSTGGFTEEALELLQTRSNKTTKYEIKYYAMEAIIKKAKNLNSKKFSEILREYYIKEI